MFVLETDRLLLRRLTMDDLDPLAAMYADPVVLNHWGRTYDREETRQGLQRILASYDVDGYGLWATISKADGCFLGRCGLIRQTVSGEDVPEVAYMLAKEVWNQGLGTEIARAIRDWGFGNLECERLISLIVEENLPSQRVAEKNGMRQVGEVVHGGWPHRLYAISRTEWEAL